MKGQVEKIKDESVTYKLDRFRSQLTLYEIVVFKPYFQKAEMDQEHRLEILNTTHLCEHEVFKQFIEGLRNFLIIMRVNY